MQGDGKAVPLHPLGHSQLKTWKNGAKQINKHSTGSQGGFSPLALIYSGETNMKKKVLIELELIKLVKSTYVSE